MAAPFVGLPRDPRFLERAGSVLDLYEHRWEGELPHPGDFVICAGEKTQIQARQRDYPTLAPVPGRVQRVDHDYDRGGALCYLAAWDVHGGRLMGRCEQQTGIVPFGRLVEQVMTAEPTRAPGACSGSSTTAPPTAARWPPIACGPRGPTSCSSTCPSTPLG